MEQLELSAQNAGPLQLKLSRILCIVIWASFGMKGKDILRFVDEKQYRWLKENRSKIIGRLEV